VTGARAVAEWLSDASGRRTLLYIPPRGEEFVVLQYTAAAGDWDEALSMFEASAMATKGLSPSTVTAEYYVGWWLGDLTRRYFWVLAGLVVLSLAFWKATSILNR
jgi:hypothetical protein